MISDNTLRQNIKTVAWFFILTNVCGLIDPASFRSADDFYAGLTAGFTLRELPLKLFFLLNIIAGAGLLHLCNFWRLYVITVLWIMVTSIALMALMFGFAFRSSSAPDFIASVFYLAVMLFPGAMLLVLHTPRVRAMFTKEAAPYAAAVPPRPSLPTGNQVPPPKRQWTTVSDQSWRRRVKMIGLIMIAINTGMLAASAISAPERCFSGEFAKYLSISGLPLTLFYLFNIVTGAGLFSFHNFWRCCAIVVLWPTAIFMAITGCFFVFLMPPAVLIMIPAAVIWLSPFAMLWVLHHPRVRAIFTQKTASGAAGANVEK